MATETVQWSISGVAASKSTRNNPPTTGNAEDEKGDLDKSSAINFEQKCKYIYTYIYIFRKTWRRVTRVSCFMSCDTVYAKNSKGFVYFL